MEAVKEKVWKKCGTSVDSMILELYDEDGSKVADPNDNSLPLGFFSPLDGLVLFLIFNFHHSLHIFFLQKIIAFCNMKLGSEYFDCLSYRVFLVSRPFIFGGEIVVTNLKYEIV